MTTRKRLQTLPSTLVKQKPTFLNTLVRTQPVLHLTSDYWCCDFNVITKFHYNIMWVLLQGLGAWILYTRHSKHLRTLEKRLTSVSRRLLGVV